MTGSGRRVRSIECVDDLPFCKNVDADGGDDLEVVGRVGEQVILVDSPHKSVDAIDTTDQVIAPFLYGAEIQCLHKAHGTFPCLGMASPLPPSSMEVSAVIGGNVVKPRAELMMLWRLKR